MEKFDYMSVDENESIIAGIKKLNRAGTRILLVTRKECLVGTVTDGDVRRWVLKLGDMHARVKELMNPDPIVLLVGEEDKAQNILIQKKLLALPVVNENHIVQNVIFLRDLLAEDEQEYRQINTPVVIMAGGKGTRLLPYTNILPKPLMPICGQPIIDHIMASFRKNGCRDFYLTLNYKKNLISTYMADREDDYNLRFIEEDDFYGTCGSISLLKGDLTKTFFVSNCDVLLDIDYAELLEYHKECCNEITMVVALKSAQLPYGVVEIDSKGSVSNISEKPLFTNKINTGIYVMEPHLIDEIPVRQVYHMTDLLKKLLDEGRKVGAYPIREEQWDDMGEVLTMRDMIYKYAQLNDGK